MNKFKSAKLWVTIWAVAMVTFIVVADRSHYTDIAQWLCAVPLAYIGANVVQKKIYSDKDKSASLKDIVLGAEDGKGGGQ